MTGVQMQLGGVSIPGEMSANHYEMSLRNSEGLFHTIQGLAINKTNQILRYLHSKMIEHSRISRLKLSHLSNFISPNSSENKKCMYVYHFIISVYRELR